MNFKLAEHIEYHFKIDKAKVIDILKENITSKIQVFPDKIMRGIVYENSFRAKLNHSKWFVDPFKSILIGSVENDFVTVKVIPSWIIRMFLIAWFMLTLYMLFDNSYNDIFSSLKFIGLIIVWLAFPFLLTKLKVYSDRKRFEKFLNSKI